MADARGITGHSKVFVGNLSFQTTSADVEALFRPFGEVIGVNLRVDRVTGRPRGFGFVTFLDETSAPDAIRTLHGTSHQGRVLTVREADKRGGEGATREGDEERDDSWKTVPDAPRPRSSARGGAGREARGGDGRGRGGGSSGGGGGGGGGKSGNKKKSWTTWASPPVAKKAAAAAAETTTAAASEAAVEQPAKSAPPP